MVKRKDRQYNGQKKRQTIQWPKERTDNVLSVLSFSHCIVYPFFWPLYCLSFLLASVLSVLSFGHCIVTMQWPKQRTNNTMAKTKDKQYNDQKKGQTLQWPKERTDNTMTKRKDKQYNDPIVLSVLSFSHCIVYPFFWPLYCLSFLLVIVLSVLSFGHCIVCPFFWSLHCLSFLLVIVLSVLPLRKDRQYNDQKKG
jgi:membrane protein implicated in regulation of membrane protease activity